MGGGIILVQQAMEETADGESSRGQEQHREQGRQDLLRRRVGTANCSFLWHWLSRIKHITLTSARVK